VRRLCREEEGMPSHSGDDYLQAARSRVPIARTHKAGTRLSMKTNNRSVNCRMRHDAGRAYSVVNSHTLLNSSSNQSHGKLAKMQTKSLLAHSLEWSLEAPPISCQSIGRRRRVWPSSVAWPLDSRRNLSDVHTLLAPQKWAARAPSPTRPVLAWRPLPAPNSSMDRSGR